MSTKAEAQFTIFAMIETWKVSGQIDTASVLCDQSGKLSKIIANRLERLFYYFSMLNITWFVNVG